MASRLVLFFAVLAAQGQGASAETLSLSSEGQAKEAALEKAWSAELQEPELVKFKSPIQRVVALLTKMKDELIAEGDKEAEMYDKMVCWCETSEKEKTKAVADADAKEAALESELDERQARFGVLSTEIDQTKNDIVELTEALKTATSIREQGAKDFRAEETDLVQAIDNLKNAIFVLGKHQGGSFLQLDNSMLSSLRVMLRDTALKYEELLATIPEAEAKKRITKRQSLASLLQMKQSDATRDLLEAMDVHGPSVPSDEVPLKFAQRVVARRAKMAAHGSAGAFLQAKAAQPATGVGTTSYSARSDGIYGILTQMLEEFEAELKMIQKEEVKSVSDYEALAAAKSEQISASKAKLDDMEGEFYANQKAISDAQEDLELTRNQRTEDIKFLQNLQTTCNDLDTQWERRSKTRSDELAAVSETIVILTEDDNWESLQKTISFLQAEAGTEVAARARRTKAADMLRRAAQAPDFDADDLLSAWQNRKGSHARKGRTVGAGAGPRGQLSTLALSVQLDSFTKVKEMMDTMVAELKKEQVEEVEFKAFCGKELDQTEKTTYHKNVLKKDLETKLDQLAALMDKLAKEIAEAQSQIADTKTEILKASQGREEENSVFQTTVADQRATQAILKKALDRMLVFYKKVKGGSFFQKGQQTPPVQFNKYKDNTGASPVIGLIKQITEESKAAEAAAIATEKQAQADYETLVKDSNALIAELDAAIVAKSKAIAKAKEDTADTQMDLDSTISELESLAQYDIDLHAQCDFTLKNFDIRQKARLQEMEAIQAAKGILSGDTQLS